MESHYTATGLVINATRTKALLIFHKKIQLWLPAGGHIEPGELPHQAALREVFEETGVRAIIIDAAVPLNIEEGTNEIQVPAPSFVLYEHIPAHHDKPAHLHYDFIYHMQTDNEGLVPNMAETSYVQWFSQDELLSCKTTKAIVNMYMTLLK